MLIPRKAVPTLVVPTLTHGEFDLQREQPAHFTLIVFYRGLHCPACAKYLQELGRLLPEFAQRGVNVIAISHDTRERAEAMRGKLEAPNLRIGYGLGLATARDWGLYISATRGKSSLDIEETALFPEPGLFLVKPDGTLYFAAVQNMPFARPHFDELISAVDFVIAKNYAARGEYVGAV